MLEYKRLATSAEVWAVIRAKHSEDLGVFSTISEPEGSPYGDSRHCRMMTEYGVYGADTPIIGAETTWQKHPVNERERVDETTKYWLCVVNNNED